MNIYKREFKAHRKSLIWWSVGMLFMVYAGMAKYGAFTSSGQDVTKLFGKMPKALMAVFGIGNVDLTTTIGFYTVLFIYVFVMAAIQSSLLGAGILAEEELDRTAEFLFAKPVSRVRAVTAKLLAAITSVTILNLVTSVSSILFVQAYNKNGPSATKDIILMMIGMYLASLVFLLFGTAAAAIVKKPKLAAPIASGYMFTAFFLKLWLDISEKAQWLKYLTPFRYFDAVTISKDSALDPVFVILSGVLIIGLAVLTFYTYRKRDLYV